MGRDPEELCYRKEEKEQSFDVSNRSQHVT